jgi:antitoxin CptB
LTTHDDPNIEVRRKKLRFRSWHRGMREADLLLGAFADRMIERMTPEQLARFEALLNESDPDILSWIMAGAAAPDEVDTDVLHLLKNFKYMK